MPLDKIDSLKMKYLEAHGAWVGVDDAGSFWFGGVEEGTGLPAWGTWKSWSHESVREDMSSVIRIQFWDDVQEALDVVVIDGMLVVAGDWEVQR